MLALGIHCDGQGRYHEHHIWYLEAVFILEFRGWMFKGFNLQNPGFQLID